MDLIIHEVIGWAVPVLCAALLAFMASTWRSIRSLRDGVRSLLRCELVHAHRRYVVNSEPMAMDDLEYAQRTYQAYHGLGGNGLGTKLWEDIKSVKITEG